MELNYVKLGFNFSRCCDYCWRYGFYWNSSTSSRHRKNSLYYIFSTIHHLTLDEHLKEAKINEISYRLFAGCPSWAFSSYLCNFSCFLKQLDFTIKLEGALYD